MNKELFDKLNSISDKIFDMDIQVKRMNESLDELIKALHEYDDENIYSGYDEPNDALKEAAEQYKAKVKPCVGHDAASWEQEDELNKRMDIIGQNGNTGEHYTDVEYDDYGQRVVEDKDKSNNPAKHMGESKPLVEGKNKSQHKHGTGKTQAAPPPKPPKRK